MIRTLSIIAGAGLVLATACFAGAAALGADDLRMNNWTWTWMGDDQHGGEFVPGTADLGSETTKTVVWTGTDRLTIEVPMDVTYIQGPAATVVVTGPQKLVERLRVDGGRIALVDEDEDGETVTFSFRNGLRAMAASDRVKITVTAPSVTRFDIEGSSDVIIRDYDQDTMDVDISGSGEVVATGRVRALRLDIAGSGEADLAGLATTDASVAIAGSGDARVAPTGRADLSIAGSGDIEVTTRPTNLTRDVSGSGDVELVTFSSERLVSDTPPAKVRVTRSVEN